MDGKCYEMFYDMYVNRRIFEYGQYWYSTVKGNRYSNYLVDTDRVVVGYINIDNDNIVTNKIINRDQTICIRRVNTGEVEISLPNITGFFHLYELSMIIPDDYIPVVNLYKKIPLEMTSYTIHINDRFNALLGNMIES